MIAVISIITFKLLIDIQINNYLTLIAFTFLSSFILGNVGIIAGFGLKNLTIWLQLQIL